MKYVFIFIIASAVFRSIEQIRCFRPNRTWLPRWIYSGGGWLNLDGYHIFSQLNLWSMFAVGFLFLQSAMPWWWIPILWFIHGNTFSLFYHVLFMKPGFRDNFVLMWFRELLGIQRRPKMDET